MGARLQGVRAGAAVHVFALALFTALASLAQAQESALPQKLPFAAAEQEAYLDDLIRNAPRGWAHGKNWVLINPYVLGRNVSQPSAKTLCPDDAGLASLSSGGTDIPSWIYSSPELCSELASSHDSAVVALEDRNDNDAAYFLFLACDMKRSRNHCDIEPYGAQDGMKLEESNKGGHRQFDVLASTMDSKTSRFQVAEVWHLHEAGPGPGAP